MFICLVVMYIIYEYGYGNIGCNVYGNSRNLFEEKLGNFLVWWEISI